MKEIGKLTVDEFVVNVLFAEKDPDDMTFDEIREALAYYLPESRFARKRKRTDTDAHALTLVVDEPEFNGGFRVFIHLFAFLFITTSFYL